MTSCALKGCDQPAAPPTFWRDETVAFVTGKSGKSKGGLGLCEDHDARMTALVRHRRQVSKLHNSNPDPSLVYFIRGARPASCAGLIKIGTSDQPPMRRHQLGGEVLLIEPGGRAHEGRLHAEFWHLWVTGEWYRPGPDLLNYIGSRSVT
jgi:hypothetical protein